LEGLPYFSGFQLPTPAKSNFGCHISKIKKALRRSFLFEIPGNEDVERAVKE
jgi:hypothetical protein